MQYQAHKKWAESTSLLKIQTNNQIYWVFALILLLGGVFLMLMLNQAWIIVGVLIATLVAMCYTIWKQNQTIAYLKASNKQIQFLQQAFDTIPNYIFVKDDKGQYVLANRAFAHRHDLTPQTIIGKTDKELYGDVESQQYEQDDLTIMQTNQTRITPELQVSDRETGEPIWVQVVKVPLILDQQKARHILAIITDITEQKQKQDELKQTNRAHAEFVAYASHDIKSPLTALQMSVGYLLEIENKALTAKQIRTLHSMMRSIEQITNLVTDLSMLMQVASTEFVLHKTAVSVHHIIEKILHSMETSFSKRQHEVQNLIPYDLPLICADSHRVAQILMNIVSNAYKYTPDGGQILLTGQKTADDMVCLSVIDTGLGIKEEEQEQLFNHFFRSADKEANQMSGTGLGLSVTKKLVDAHNGRIWFESTYRQGTAFHIELPIAKEQG